MGPAVVAKVISKWRILTFNGRTAELAWPRSWTIGENTFDFLTVARHHAGALEHHIAPQKCIIDLGLLPTTKPASLDHQRWIQADTFARGAYRAAAIFSPAYDDWSCTLNHPSMSLGRLHAPPKHLLKAFFDGQKSKDGKTPTSSTSSG